MRTKFLDSIRRTLCGSTSFLIDDWSITEDICRVRGWFLSGYESVDTYGFRVNGRRPDVESLGLASPSLATVFPFFENAASAGFEFRTQITLNDLSAQSLEVALCDRLFGEPANSWQTTHIPTTENCQPVPDADQLQRTQGNTSLARYLAYGLSTSKKIERILATYFRTTIEDAGPILDWGVGCGRVVRHFVNRNPSVFGSDIDADNVRWCAASLPGKYIRNDLFPRLDFDDSHFGLVYAISVFTHLDQDAANAWRDEIHRVLRPRGIAIFTIHGSTGIGRILDDRRLNLLASNGFDASSPDARLDKHIEDRTYYRATFQSAHSVRQFFGQRFRVIDQIVGANALLQDFVVLEKR